MSEIETTKKKTKSSVGRLLLRRSLLTFAAIGIAIWIRACVAAPLAVPETGVILGPKYRASGVVHIHTSLSDGRGTPAEVIEAARLAKADFIVITDHNRVDPRAFDGLTRAGDPIVIVGSEVSTEAGHVLAIGIRAPQFKFSGTLSEVLEDIRYLGGCAFAAHPTSARGETRFTREGEPGTWGVEIVNGDSAWREASPMALALAAWSYPANGVFALRKTLGAFAAERALWDRILRKRFAPAVGGTDAHGRIPISRTRSLPIPSYESLFGLVRTLVHLNEPLPDDASHERAREAITKAICAGESVVAIPSLADPKGFSFVAQSTTDRVVGPGSTVVFEPGIKLRAGGGLPAGVILRLMEPEGEIAHGEGTLDFAVTKPGIYRIEVYLRGERTPWILSNPISILTPEMELNRRLIAMPIPAGYTEGKTELDRFENTTAFAAEHDSGSTIDQPILDLQGGRGKGAAARLSFHLNPIEKPPVWTALVDRTPRDLSKSRGVSFWMRGDGEYRIWFQIRDLNAASADEGTEAWFASVRTSPAWTLYNIPFKSLRSINRTTDGSFDAGKVAHIVFVIDHGAMPFGSHGKIWIDDLMAY